MILRLRPRFLNRFLEPGEIITLWPFVLSPKLPLSERDIAHEKEHWLQQGTAYAFWGAVLIGAWAVVGSAWPFALLPICPWYFGYLWSSWFRRRVECQAVAAELLTLPETCRRAEAYRWARKLSLRYKHCGTEDQCMNEILRWLL